MRDDNYEKIVKKVAISSGLDVSEIEKRVEAKRSKLAGLISLEGAAQVVAAELGISFENERSKINDLLPGMRNIKVVLWDTNHISLIENGEMNIGSIVEIMNGTMRDNEIHLGSFSEIKLSKEILENVQTEKMVKDKSIVDFRVGDNTSVRAFIVQTFEPKFFHVCSECKKKVITECNNFKCNEHGLVSPEKRALINVVLDDGA